LYRLSGGFLNEIGDLPTAVTLAQSVALSYNTPPCEAPMPFTLRSNRRFLVPCAVTYHTRHAAGGLQAIAS